MQINIVEYLEKAAQLWPDKKVYQDDNEFITFTEVMNECNKIGSMLCHIVPQRSPVIIFAQKGVHVASMYLGVAAAGCFYIPLDADLPVYRLKLIFDMVQPELVLTDGIVSLPDELDYTGRVIAFKECITTETDISTLKERRKKQLDIDPLYVIFTSGSTGTPKGVVASHRNVIDYIDTFAETFGISETDIFGNQAPLDYVAALRDLYLPLCTGAQTVLLPKLLFSQPVKLFETINKNKITILCWVSPALSLYTQFSAFKGMKFDSVKQVFFTGSVLPVSHLQIWQDNLPNALFINHYGPTEITASCTYYIVDHKVSSDENIPIGIPFRNTDILLLNEDGQLVSDGETGEICVRGAGLALGYFKNPDKTREVFIPNPTQPYVNETIYKTGDLGKKQPDGNYTFHGRMDSQIKHMGHRIELSEIETAALSMSGISGACCLYQNEKELIWLFYEGSPEIKEMTLYLRERLPGFMVPRKIEQLDKIPKMSNGKIDRTELKKQIL